MPPRERSRTRRECTDAHPYSDCISPSELTLTDGICQQAAVGHGLDLPAAGHSGVGSWDGQGGVQGKSA